MQASTFNNVRTMNFFFLRWWFFAYFSSKFFRYACMPNISKTTLAYPFFFSDLSSALNFRLKYYDSKTLSWIFPIVGSHLNNLSFQAKCPSLIGCCCILPTENFVNSFHSRWWTLSPKARIIKLFVLKIPFNLLTV